MLLTQLLAYGYSNKILVVGGVEVEAHSEPHILSIQKTGSHFCGGSLLAPNHGLSAAHCNIYTGVNAVAGAHNLKNVEDAQQNNPVTFLSHPLYNANTFRNDIALLTFNGKTLYFETAW